MTGSPKLSVCVPVWNESEWLGGAIESVLAQTYPDWQLVIGDNASEEDLAVVVERYKDPRILYHRFDTHVDIFENYNRTGHLASSEWVQMLSADDRLMPECLGRMAERLGRAVPGKAPALILTACSRVGARGDSAEKTFYGHSNLNRISDGRYSPAEWFRIMTNPGQLPWNFGSASFSRTVLTQTGWMRPDVGHGADIELILRASVYGDVEYIDEPLMQYTVRGNSDSSTRVQRNLSEGDRYTDYSAAWESALRAHALIRGITDEERSRAHDVMARSHIQRAIQHRIWRGGRGRAGALGDIKKALGYNIRLLRSPVHIGAGLMAILAPSVVISWVMNRYTDRRYPDSQARTSVSPS